MSVLRGTSNDHEIMVNIISTGGDGVGDRKKGSAEENCTYGAAGVLWDFSWRSVGAFNGGGGIGMADGDNGDRLCVWVEMRK